ncbi:MAG: DUF1501 domain-containing protein [Verrucomicrobia bacterium]|nr:DUF1501 domain-containing protein [Verrucomicrobiota bacterium]
MKPAKAILHGNGDLQRTLVVVFLRGGADGLALLPAVGDDDYHRARPLTAVGESEAIRLDDRFGLSPVMAALEPAVKEGALSAVHCVGSGDTTRSHFEAQDLMEHGGHTGGGWLGRFLRFREQASGGALSAVALGQAVPESLRGAPSATAMQSLDDFSFSGSDAFVQSLEQLYGGQAGVFGARARDTFDALGRIRDLHANDYSPANGAEYGGGRFARELRLAAQLIQARVGVEAVTVDLGGWDTHLSQAPLISPLLRRLADGLGAFRRDLGAAMQQTTVVVMSEFGRRVSENSALGTDHGRGGAMFVLGGDGAEGRVIADWPGLERDALVGPGDLPVTTDYRDVLIPLLRRHAPGADMAKVFPGHEARPLGEAVERA